MTKQLVSLVGMLALVVSGQVLAGTADVRSNDGETTRFEYRGDKLRIGMGGQADSYMIMRENRVFVVNESNGDLMVMDISQAMSMFGAMAGAATPSLTDDEVISLEATGRKETHAGVTGEVYNLRYRESGGEVRDTEIVLTGDKRALAFRDAMFEFANAMANNLGNQQQDTSDMYKTLMDKDKGVLRYGNEMTVVNLDTATVDAARFELPAEPMDMSSIGAIFSGAFSGANAPADEAEAEGESQGGLGGLLGAFRKPPAEDGDAAEGEEEEASNPAEEINKALRGLFNR